MAKVLHFIAGLNVGGAERMLLKLVAADSSSNQHQVICLGSCGPIGEQLKARGVAVTALDLSSKFPLNLNLLFSIYKFRKNNFDVLQGWMYHGNLAAFFFSLFAKNQTVLIFGIRQTLSNANREKLITRLAITLNSKISSAADWVVYNSIVSRNQHEARGFSSANGAVIPNGFDALEFRRVQEKMTEVTSRRWAIGLNDGDFSFGVFCRNHPMKGLDVFIDACLDVCKMHENIHFILVGPGMAPDNFPFRAKLSGQNNFHFLGESSDVILDMLLVDCVVSPSKWGEAFSNTICEAMLLELPVIVTDVGESARLAKFAGLTIPPQDEQALSAAMSSMVGFSETQRKKMGSNGRRKISACFSIEKAAKQFSSIYAAKLGDTDVIKCN